MYKGGVSLVRKCPKCKRVLKLIKYNDEKSNCHECTIKELQSIKWNTQIRNQYRAKERYSWVFKQLKEAPFYNVYVNNLIYQELCIIDKRFKHIKKDNVGDGYVLYAV